MSFLVEDMLNSKCDTLESTFSASAFISDSKEDLNAAMVDLTTPSMDLASLVSKSVNILSISTFSPIWPVESTP